MSRHSFHPGKNSTNLSATAHRIRSFLGIMSLPAACSCLCDKNTEVPPGMGTHAGGGRGKGLAPRLCHPGAESFLFFFLIFKKIQLGFGDFLYFGSLPFL